MDSESTKLAILLEAMKHGNQIYKLQDEAGEFIKLKHSYSQPADLRSGYLTAMNSLLNGGLVRQVFTSDDVQLFEVTSQGKAFTTLSSAKELIQKELAGNGRLYKIHSQRGEFVQCGANSINQIDSERIVYMQALQMLLHRGIIRVTCETSEMATYELDANQLHTEQYHQR
ncbi:hypothetical protein BH10CYA1_BH10CYA1_40280 [soil metagenome]